jgi:hypothetical protein
MTHEEFQKLKDGFVNQVKNSDSVKIINGFFGVRK